MEITNDKYLTAKVPPEKPRKLAILGFFNSLLEPA